MSGPTEFPDPYKASALQTTPPKIELAPTLVHKSSTKSRDGGGGDGVNRPITTLDSNYIGGIKIHGTGVSFSVTVIDCRSFTVMEHTRRQ